jgi:hypothetical protein
VYKWEGLIPQKRKAVPVADSVLTKFIGNYLINRDTVVIGRKDNNLVIGIKGTPIEWKVYFTGPGQFIILEVNGDFSVAKENGGKVESIELKQGGIRNYFTRLQ